jgi:predicted TIM-barrel fold metal-dependent hydrolase
MAHAGGMRFQDLLVMSRRKRLNRLNNLYVDFSSVLFDIADGPMAPIFTWTMAKIGLDRVIMGSDFPDHSVQDTVRHTRNLGFDTAGRQLVMGANAIQVYGTT